MKTLGPFVALVVLASIAAGCAGGALSGSVPAASSAANGIAAPAANHLPRATLVMPLVFNGMTFATAGLRSCSKVGEAPRYTPATTHQLTLTTNVVLHPTCVRTSASRLYVVGAQLGKGGESKADFAPIAGPVQWHDRPWSFRPSALGIHLSAGAHYVFYVAAIADQTPWPSPSPGSGRFLLLHPLSFNGTNFTIVPGPCFEGDPNDAPPYVAPTSGPLVLSGSISIAPTCAPSPLPSFSPLPGLYVVAIPLTNSSSDRVGHTAAARWPALNASLSNLPIIPAVAIAGPANLANNPWVFAPDSPGLTTEGGMSYGFFIAIPAPMRPPLPSQPHGYRAIVPLNFDGTTFSVASSSCTPVTAPTPYAPPSSGPLTLTGPVVIAPTCAPSPPASSASAPPLYIVVTIADWRSRWGNPARRPRPDWGGTQHSFLWGIAIAGPVTATNDPWSFTPLSPSLTLSQGVSYLFYVASPGGFNRWSRGDPRGQLRPSP
jgi:hypothetical protein